MRRTTRNKTIIVALLCVTLLGMSVGFSIMSSTLNILGTAEVDPATWDIHFANLVQSNKSSSVTVLTAPTIQSGTTLGSFDVQLTRPGDTITYTFDVVNNGGFDAELVTYVKGTPVCTGENTNAVSDAKLVCGDLTYTLTYSDGTAIKQGDTLSANGGTKGLILTLTYNTSATELPTNKVEISNLGITFVYAQTGSGADMEDGTLPELTSNYPALASTIRSSLASNTDDTMFTDDYGNIRYRGTNPNNYITFNGETWRIIGIVDGYIKIIRNSSIGYYAWDSSDSSVNSGWGVNEWSQADLMYELNDLYLNQKSGLCYDGDYNHTTSCDFTSTGINSTARAMIQESTWHLGGWNTIDITTSVMYEKERGTTVIQNPSDGVTRTTQWTGLIALMYPSDIGYSVISSCSTNKTLSSYKENNGECLKTTWMYDIVKGGNNWLLTPSTKYADCAFDFWEDSEDETSIAFDTVANDNTHYVLPTLHLKPNVVVTGGNGTSGTPYTIQLAS